MPRNEKVSSPGLTGAAQTPRLLAAASSNSIVVALTRSTSLKTTPKPFVCAAVSCRGRQVRLRHVAADRSERRSGENAARCRRRSRRGRWNRSGRRSARGCRCRRCRRWRPRNRRRGVENTALTPWSGLRHERGWRRGRRGRCRRRIRRWPLVVGGPPRWRFRRLRNDRQRPGSRRGWRPTLGDHRVGARRGAATPALTRTAARIVIGFSPIWTPCVVLVGICPTPRSTQRRVPIPGDPRSSARGLSGACRSA